MGTTMGMRIAIVPHELPVAKAMTAASRKTSTGIHCGARLSPISPTA